MGEELLFEPLRRLVAERIFQPFAGLTDIVPAALGEEVVVHGAIALATSDRLITRLRPAGFRPRPPTAAAISSIICFVAQPRHQ